MCSTQMAKVTHDSIVLNNAVVPSPNSCYSSGCSRTILAVYYTTNVHVLHGLLVHSLAFHEGFEKHFQWELKNFGKKFYLPTERILEETIATWCYSTFVTSLNVAITSSLAGFAGQVSFKSKQLSNSLQLFQALVDPQGFRKRFSSFVEDLVPLQTVKRYMSSSHSVCNTLIIMVTSRVQCALSG